MTTSSAHEDFARSVTSETSTGLPPGRLEELQPRLHALLADFAHLEELEALELEPMPAFVVTPARGDRDG
jgi:hypothetical protein